MELLSDIKKKKTSTHCHILAFLFNYTYTIRWMYVFINMFIATVVLHKVAFWMTFRLISINCQWRQFHYHTHKFPFFSTHMYKWVQIVSFHCFWNIFIMFWLYPFWPYPFVDLFQWMCFSLSATIEKSFHEKEEKMNTYMKMINVKRKQCHWNSILVLTTVNNHYAYFSVSWIDLNETIKMEILSLLLDVNWLNWLNQSDNFIKT